MTKPVMNVSDSESWTSNWLVGVLALTCCISDTGSISAQNKRVPSEVRIVTAMSDEEISERYLQLAGDDPQRQEAVKRWANVDWITDTGPVLIEDPFEDAFEGIECMGCNLSATDLQDLKFFPEITRLEFHGTPLSEEVLRIVSQHKTLKHLWCVDDPTLDNRICEIAAQLPDLLILTLRSPGIDDKGVKLLSRNHTITMLELDGSNMTRMAAEDLSMLINLTHLNVSPSSFDDRAMKALGKLTKLQWLELPACLITDGGISHLRALSELAVIDFSSTAVTDASAPVFAEWRKLNRVNLDNTKITNRALTMLSGLPKLRELSLRNTAIDDACLPELLKMELRRLDIRGTRISSDGVARVQNVVTLVLKSDYSTQ